MAVGEGRRERRSSKQDKGEDIGRCIWTYGPDVRCMMNAAVSLRTHGPEVLLPGYCSWHYATLNSGSEFDTFEQFCLWLDVQIEDGDVCWQHRDPEDWWKLVQGRGISPKAPWHPVDDRHCPHIPATSHERIVKPHEARKLVGEILRNLGDSPMMRGTPEPEVDLSHD